MITTPNTGADMDPAAQRMAGHGRQQSLLPSQLRDNVWARANSLRAKRVVRRLTLDLVSGAQPPPLIWMAVAAALVCVAAACAREPQRTVGDGGTVDAAPTRAAATPPTTEPPALLSMQGAITAFSTPGVVPFGMLSDPTSDFGMDGLFLSKEGASRESIVGGYPFGLITRKFVIAHQTAWPSDFALSGFSVATEDGQRDLTYATKWGRTPDGRRNGWVAWEDDGAGNPTHIVRSHASDGVISVDSTVFTRDGAVTYLWDVENLHDLTVVFDWTTPLAATIVSAQTVTVDEGDLAVLESRSMNAWLAVVGAGAVDRTIDATLAGEKSASVRVNFAGVDSDTPRLAVSVGWSGNSREEAIERALSGATIQSVERRLQAATTSWSELQSGVRFPDSITVEDERFVRGILNHVASHSFEMSRDHWYMVPSNGGVNQHAWIRDTFVTALGVARFHPEMAANMVRWMADHPGASNVLEAEWFHYDGTVGTNRSTNIDAIAWLALSIGRVFDALPQSERASFALDVRGLIDQVYDYVSARWDPGTEHINISPHLFHDWWDDWDRLQDTGIGDRQFRFEMGPEVLFASGLRLLAPICEILDARSLAQDFALWGAELESNLEDFELPGNRGLSPAIDVNGDLVDAPDMIYVWGNVKAAAFLGRRASYEALVTNQKALRRPGLAFFSLQQAYYDAQRGPKENGSNLFEWLITGVDARWGTGELGRHMRSLFYLPWSPRDHLSSDGDLYLPNTISYMMTAAFQLESVRLMYEPEPLHQAPSSAP